MKFGVKAEDDVNSGDGGGEWIHYINKNGEYTFRFLEDYPSGWTVYWDHFSAAKKMAYPCTGDRNSCPGCTSGDEREAKGQKRLLVNAVLISGENQGYAHLWKFAGGLKDDIERARGKSTKNTILDRPFTITRYEGSNGFVSYALDREDPAPFDASQYELQDHQEALMEAWRRANEEEEESETRREPDHAPKKASEEEVPEALQSKSERTRLSAVRDEPTEDVTYSPAKLRTMNSDELLKLYRQTGYDTPEDWTDSRDLADHLIGLLRGNAAPVGN